MTRWLHRAVLVVLLLAAYLWAWTPARTAWTEHAADLLRHASPAETTVTARPLAHTIRVTPRDAPPSKHTAPAGIKFLLPGLFLLLLAPTRPRLAVFFAGHLALGGLALALLAAGLNGILGGRLLARFAQTYGTDAYSLAVPVFVFVHRHRAGGRS